MALNFDDTQPLVGSARRRDLLRAVLEATDADELDWLEWKATLDLGNKQEVGKHLARHILGMANRHPDLAARKCDGWGVVIAGVEPGSLGGIRPVDPADLEPAIRGHMDSPVPFEVNYEQLHGSAVLVVAVAPPRWGDPKRYLAADIRVDDRDGKGYTAGTVFVRRQGATHQANVAEQQMLDTRMAATRGKILLDVHAAQGNEVVVHALDLSDAAVGEWLEAETSRLLDPLETQETEEQARRLQEEAGRALDEQGNEDNARGGSPSLQVPDILSGRIREAFEVAKRARPQIEAQMDALERAGLVRREDRPPDEYRTQVQRWATQAQEGVRGETLSRAFQNKCCLVALTMTNSTERNFEDVQIELKVPGEALAFESENDIEHVGIPPRPRLWGTPPPEPPLLGGRFLRVPHSSRPDPLFPLPRIENDNDQSANLKFPGEHLRPLTSETLPSFHLLVPPSIAGQTITATWRATARNADSETTGTITIRVAEEPLRPVELLTDDGDH